MKRPPPLSPPADRLPWFRGGILSLTPYSDFEKRRRRFRIAVYALLVAGAVAYLAAMLNPKFIYYLISLRVVEQRIVALAPIVLAGLMLMAVAVLSHPRVWLPRFAGRCLRCGDDRLLHYVDECGACKSSLAEQDAYRRMVDATPSARRAYRGLSRPVADLMRMRRAWIIALAVGGCITAVTFAWMLRTAPANSRLSSIQTVCAVLCLIACFPGAVIRAVFEHRRSLANIRRLAGCCLACETPLHAGDDLGPVCGSSIIIQHHFARQLQFSQLGRMRHMPAACARDSSPNSDSTGATS